MSEEIWKPVKGYNGLYQVSNLGNIRRITKCIKCKNGTVKIIHGKNLKQINHIYKYVILSKNSIQKHHLVHRLVAQSFIPNPENKPCVDHINTTKTDNRAENLRWVNHSENMRNTLTINIFCKKVLCVETGKVFNSAIDAEKNTGIGKRQIGAVCRGERKTTHGYHWRFV